MVETHLGEETLKAKPSLDRSTALGLIVVDDNDAVRGPTEFNSSINKGVLAEGGLAVLGDLLGRGLADVNDGQPVEMPWADLGRTP